MQTQIYNLIIIVSIDSWVMCLSNKDWSHSVSASVSIKSIKVHHNTYQGVCLTCNLIMKKKRKICLKWIQKCINATIHRQSILYWDILYNIKRKKYKRFCAELALAKVTFDRMFMIFCLFFFCFFESVIFALFAMLLDQCNPQRVHGQRYELLLFKY